eukprot:5998805-Ditylum_brightwellii.AAC.1
MIEDNTEDLHMQGEILLNQDTEEDLKQLQKVIQELEIKTYSLQYLVSKSTLDAGYRASDLSHMKWE